MSKVIRSNDELNALANGKELVTNGDFSQGTTGFTFSTAGVWSVVAGQLINSGTYANATNEQTLTIGASYEITLDVAYGGAGINLFINGSSFTSLTSGFPGTYRVTTVATGTLIQLGSSGAVINSWSVKEIPQVQGENLPDYVATRSNYGFKNLIINGGFDVWQRGTSFTGGNKYTADRFKLQSNSTTDTHTRVDLGGNIYAVRVTRGSDGSYNNLFQVIENGKNKLLGKTVTVSCMARASKNVNLNITVQDTNNGDAIQNPLTSSVGITTEWTRVSATFTIGSTPNLTYPNLRVDTFSGINTLLNGDWVEVREVQLEEGSVATPFEQRPYGLELSLCQRYYERTNGTGVTMMSTRFQGSSGNTWYRHDYSVQKRITPSISLTNAGFDGAPPFVYTSDDKCMNLHSSLGDFYFSSGYIEYDAEL
jgi:hypothetical protein